MIVMENIVYVVNKWFKLFTAKNYKNHFKSGNHINIDRKRQQINNTDNWNQRKKHFYFK